MRGELVIRERFGPSIMRCDYSGCEYLGLASAGSTLDCQTAGAGRGLHRWLNRRIYIRIWVGQGQLLHSPRFSIWVGLRHTVARLDQRLAAPTRN